MTTINIYLVKRCMMMPRIERQLTENLNSYFHDVLERDPQWREDYSVEIQIGSRCPTVPSDRDVVVYLVQDASASVFSRFGVAAHGHGGLTVHNIPPGRQAASEVYVGTSVATLLSKVTFHEILHNKTGWGNNRLHHHHRTGIASAVIRVDTPVTDGDLDLMGNHLGGRHPQWSGGCR